MKQRIYLKALGFLAAILAGLSLAWALADAGFALLIMLAGGEPRFEAAITPGGVAAAFLLLSLFLFKKADRT